MKSLKNIKKNENLFFHWGPKSAKNKFKTDKTYCNDLNKYFEFLEEVKPHKNELDQITVFERPFNLNDSED